MITMKRFNPAEMMHPRTLSVILLSSSLVSKTHYSSEMDSVTIFLTTFIILRHCYRDFVSLGPILQFELCF